MGKVNYQKVAFNNYFGITLVVFTYAMENTDPDLQNNPFE